MGKQVITISPDGSVSGLQRRRGQGLDLRHIGGHAEIERVSEIRWDELNQKWFIEFLSGPFKGFTVTRHRLLDSTGRDNLDGVTATDCGKGTLLFPDYEDAVEAEIAILDGYRVKGFF